MKNAKFFFLVSVMIILYTSLNAQVSLSEPVALHCGSAQINNQRLIDNPLIQLILDEQNQKALRYEKNHDSNKGGVISYIIPVVYHIIHNNGSENVSEAEIEASIANLNEDFQKLNSDRSLVISAFLGIIADCEIEFRLAHKDPNGNCSRGITRTVSTQTYSADENVKRLINWDTRKYLNIWVVAKIPNNVLGYAYYPGTAPRQSNEGVVIRSSELGNSLTHEVGHFLNLLHTWGNSNLPGVSTNCSGDDLVSDTPNTIGNFTCNTSSNSCGSLDNTQNYMEYSFCSAMFTNGQKSRMHSALNSRFGSRNTLWSNSNLIATGTNDPYGSVDCSPISNFIYDKEYVCEGGSVTFSDDSYDGTPNAWGWTFTGGIPSTSVSQSPTIVYNTAGVYGVTYQPSSTGGLGTSVTKTSIITVSSMMADHLVPMVEGFENLNAFSDDWSVLNLNAGGVTFERTSVASYTGLFSVRIRNILNDGDGIHELLSPSYDLSVMPSKTLKFKQAFMAKSIANDDKLLVFYSKDCGNSWSLLLPILTSTVLATAADSKTNFIPANNGEWKERIVDLTSFGSEKNIRFKFQFTEGGGNNLYIDDINIGNATVGLDDFRNIASFNVYPNPTSSSAQISFNLLKDVSQLRIKVKNAIGQEVTSVIAGQAFNKGKYTLRIDEQRKLASGIYFVEFTADSNVKVQKLVVQ